MVTDGQHSEVLSISLFPLPVFLEDGQIRMAPLPKIEQVVELRLRPNAHFLELD